MLSRSTQKKARRSHSKGFIGTLGSLQFDVQAMLLSTDAAKNPFFGDGDLSGECVCRWPLEGLQSPRLLCVTDALGQWLLASEDIDATARLFALESEDAFAGFVAAECEAGRLKRDDTSLLAFW